MKNTILIVAVLLFSFISNSQDSWTTYNTADGLLNDIVTSVTIDLQGNKWFVTSTGVSKFDGTNWTNYTTSNGLVSNAVSSIKVDLQGNKWFGTNAGVQKFDGTTWTNYTSNNGLLNDTIGSIAIDQQGNKWFTTKAGVSKLSGTTWTNYTTSNGLFSNKIESVRIDQQNNKWFLSPGYLIKFDGTTWTRVATQLSLLFGGHVYGFEIDLQGNKWFTGEGGVVQFNGTTWINYPRGVNLPAPAVESVAIDLQGNKWFGHQMGYTKFDGVTWTLYRMTNIGSNFRSVSYFGFEGSNVWFSTYGGVVLYCNTGISTPIITADGNTKICYGQPVQLNSTSANKYKWHLPNGSDLTSQSIPVSTGGSYTVTVYDNNGCSATSSPIVISTFNFGSTPQICLVTNSNNKNKIVWEKITDGRLKYKVYKQNNTTSNYDFIHEQSVSDLSEFLDTSSTPDTQIARYKLSVVDSCNNESSLSSNHTTILLSSNLGTNNTVNLNWNAYEGFTYSNFEIWRSLDGVNYNLLSTVANNTFSYIDVNPNTQSYYQIRITNPNGCTSSKSTFSTALSNIIDKSGYAAGIIENSLNAMVSVFPNPSKGSFKINSPNEIINSILVFDNLGKVVYSQNEISNEKVQTIDLHNCKEGLYTLKVIINSKTLCSKIEIIK